MSRGLWEKQDILKGTHQNTDIGKCVFQAVSVCSFLVINLYANVTGDFYLSIYEFCSFFVDEEK